MNEPVQPDPVTSVAGQPVESFPWGAIQWLCASSIFPGAALTFGHVQIAPHAKNPRHYHPNSDEVLYLLEGALDHRVGDQVYHLEPGTLIYIPAGVEHDAFNPTGQVARMVVAYSTGDRQMVLCEHEPE